MRVWVVLLLVCALVAARRGRRMTKSPTKRVTPMPTLPPTHPRPSPPPVLLHTSEQYYYYAQLYYQRADFLYKFFPHEGPAFQSAQADQAKGRFYTNRAQIAAAAEAAECAAHTHISA